MAHDIHEDIRLVFEDAIRHRVFVVATFLAISVVGLIAGLNWPKVYTSSTSIYVEEQNILGPLMQGAAVQTEVSDRLNNAIEILYGRKILLKLLDQTGLSQEVINPIEQERLMEDIKARTNVTGENNLIQIEYSDSDPELTYEITKQFAELFIAESHADKARESSSAYGFIDQQAEEYKKKLVTSEEALKKFRSENIDAVPGASGDMGRRATELNSQLDQVTQQLSEARIKRQSLINQMSGAAQSTSNFTRSEDYRTRIAELQAQLDTLRLSYHETYPDIVRIKSQIEDLRKAIADESAGHGQGSGGGGAGRVDERVFANPIYQDLQRQLYETNTQVQTLESRVAYIKTNLAAQVERGKHIQEYEARLAELTRDYEVNKEIYADMTRRRESARVSMNLDREEKGLTMRVDEPAYFPHKPSGLQFMHFAIGSPLLGVLLPLGILFGVRQIDSRIRSAIVIPDRLNVPLIGVVPHLMTAAEARSESRGLVILTAVLFAGVAVLFAIMFMRFQGLI